MGEQGQRRGACFTGPNLSPAGPDRWVCNLLPQPSALKTQARLTRLSSWRVVWSRGTKVPVEAAAICHPFALGLSSCLASKSLSLACRQLREFPMALQ